jgi:hypothetical protein
VTRRAAAPRAVPGAALAALALVALAGCEPRRDVADMAVGLAPFEELRGMGFGGLRSGAVRALRARAERAPLEGLRERIGAFDVVYAVPDYAGADGAWPAEDAFIEHIEATREWPSDSLARAAFERVIGEYRALSGAAPACLRVTGRDFTVLVAEWDLGGGFAFTTTFAPGARLATGGTLAPLHSLAVRRRSLRDRFPADGAANPNDHPTWRAAGCDDA